jgi:hypothetical protein
LATAGETEVEDEEPLIAGVIHGVRKWEVGRDRKGNPRLLGFTDSAWQPWGRPTIAACLSKSGSSLHHRNGEPAPATNCTCGLYAHHPWARSYIEDYDLLAGVSPEDDWLVGVVEAWGHLEIHEDGFRAQFARPILLIASTPRNRIGEPSDLLDRVAAEYRCFAGRVGSARELKDLFGEINRGLDRSVVKELTSSIPPGSYATSDGARVPTWTPSRFARWRNWMAAKISKGLRVPFKGAILVAKVIFLIGWGIFVLMFWSSILLMVGIFVYGIGRAVFGQ